MRPAWALLLTLTTTAAPAGAQTSAPLARADVQAALGWMNLRGSASAHGGEWMHGIATADAAVGWYWSDHLRTQIDAGTGNDGRQVRTVFRSPANGRDYEIIETRVRPAAFTVTQQYQFFRNAWFHPHLGAGVQVRRERVDERHEATVAFDEARQQWIDQQPAYSTRVTRTRIAAAIDGGFKAYLSRRGFFVADARFTVDRTINGVLLRAGFGIDF